MPKLPLVNGPYPSRSLASAASELTNLYVELVESAPDQAKNAANLFGIPGRHSMLSPGALATISANGGSMRGLWSGGGRCFLMIGSWIYEINSAGGIVGTPYNTVFGDNTPVQFFGNGNQLGLVYTYLISGVLGGFFLINNGTGWTPALFQVQGVVSAVGATITWVSGDVGHFSPAMLGGLTFSINNHYVTILTRNSDTSIDLTAPIGGGSGTANLMFSGTLAWVSGTVFNDVLVGLPITVDGIVYTVKSVLSAYTLTLQNPGNDVFPESGIPVPFIAVLPNLTYQAAAGGPVSAVTGAYMDGTFYVQRPAGGTPDLGRQVNFSGVLDGTSWRGLDFFTKEGAPDYIRSILADNEILYAFGTASSEAYQNNPLPQRLQGAMVKFGSISPWGPLSVGGKVYFVGGDAQGGPVAYRIDSTIPTRISTHAEEAYWLKNGFGLNCVSYSYMEEGHVFWCINFGAETWCWDETSKFWHRRMQWDGTNFIPYTTKFHTYIPEWGTGTHITGGAGSQVFESSVNFYDDAGLDMAWRRAIPYRYNAGNRIFFGRMALEMETGTAAVDVPAPVVTRDYSDDRGNTFVNPRDASIGVHGDNSIRLYWLRNGQSRGRVWRFFGKGKSKVALIDLECDEILGTT